MIPWLDEDKIYFPDPRSALKDPDGLLAAGGDLSTDRLILAYQHGIFPWFSADQAILWWSPDPRCIIEPAKVHISRSLRKHVRKHNFRISFDQAFEQVIGFCARPEDDEGTWITDEMQEAYIELHQLGVAHSVELWRDDLLVGGLYGLSLGRCFFGESMFSRESNASKVAFAALCRQMERWGCPLIDCQVENPHLTSLGAQCIPREEFLSILEKYCQSNTGFSCWTFDDDILESL